MTATLIAMPGIRTITVTRLPLDKRAELLAWLARAALGLPPEAVTVLRDSWSHDSLVGPELQARWTDFMDKAAISDAADQGCFDWRTTDDSLLCPNRTEVATEVARQDAVDALMVLAGGLP